MDRIPQGKNKGDQNGREIVEDLRLYSKLNNNTFDDTIRERTLNVAIRGIHELTCNHVN